MARLLVALIALLLAVPAQAAVTITFWSHEFGNHFPHAFFTLRGVPDRGGAAVDANYGFTPKAMSPAILFGPVAGRIDVAKTGYMEGSDAQFAHVLSDAQYDAILRLVAEWTTDNTYRMNSRNCVHFVQEAARRAGLEALDHPGLMKKPRSFLLAVAAGNAARVTVIARHGKEYLGTLAPVAPRSVAVIAPIDQSPSDRP